MGLAPSPGATDPWEETWTPLIHVSLGPRYSRLETGEWLTFAPLSSPCTMPEEITMPQSHPVCQVPRQLPKGSASSRGTSKLFSRGNLQPLALLAQGCQKMQDNQRNMNSGKLKILFLVEVYPNTSWNILLKNFCSLSEIQILLGVLYFYSLHLASTSCTSAGNTWQVGMVSGG